MYILPFNIGQGQFSLNYIIIKANMHQRVFQEYYNDIIVQFKQLFQLLYIYI